MFLVHLPKLKKSFCKFFDNRLAWAVLPTTILEEAKRSSIFLVVQKVRYESQCGVWNVGKCLSEF